jgi:hypothetical protein
MTPSWPRSVAIRRSTADNSADRIRKVAQVGTKINRPVKKYRESILMVFVIQMADGRAAV